MGHNAPFKLLLLNINVVQRGWTLHPIGILWEHVKNCVLKNVLLLTAHLVMVWSFFFNFVAVPLPSLDYLSSFQLLYFFFAIIIWTNRRPLVLLVLYEYPASIEFEDGAHTALMNDKLAQGRVGVQKKKPTT